MATHIVKTIADLQRYISESEQMIATMKQATNAVCQMADIPMKYEAGLAIAANKTHTGGTQDSKD